MTPQNGSVPTRVCVIGAGSSGIAACQVLKERGIDFDCFEKGSGVGGNWRYRNDNGMSAAYESLFINTSRMLMEYASYPMPEELPDYPHHTQIAAYFDDFVDHFGFRDRIRFRTEVTRVEPAAEGPGWDVTTDDGETRRYWAVMVANGHHWNPRWPDPPYPGEFWGEETHAHSYDTPEGYEGANVLVLGIGNSATDIAVELSRIAKTTQLAMRRGAWVLPKYIAGKPLDQSNPAPALFSRLPLAAQRALFMRSVKPIQGPMESYGLPTPDHKLLEAHPTISAELLGRIGHGRIAIRPNIERLEGDRVRFEDGSVAPVDKIIYCTGYRITFPFLGKEIADPDHNRIDLYRRVVHPTREGLYFIGLVQPLGAIMPLAEAQSHWVADLLEGKARLPERERMQHAIDREWRRMQRRYVRSDRHTIQVDFFPHLRDIARGRKLRRGRSVAIPSGTATPARARVNAA
jgi:cation diffusion facilitator CzcD-associated flavoprotein CzcO